MKKKSFIRYYLFACAILLLLSFYPLWMGVQVVGDMLADRMVMKENYPKYIIPYTPISVAVFTGALLMPLCMKLLKRHALLGGSAYALTAFFGLEWLFEKKVVVATAETVTVLEDWQMYMCYQPPGGWGTETTTYKTQTAVDILMGNYSPAFKLHFYVISVVLILAILNCVYGFAQVVKTGDKKRVKPLIMQSISTSVFLGLCILACFTAFWRDGSIQVSPLSASLMAVFFILLGVTVGFYVGSFLLGKCKGLAVWLPAVVASVMTLLMYVGELILLNGHLYRFGTGFFFDGLPGIVLAPVDVLIAVAAGGVTALLFSLTNKTTK